MDGGFWYSIPDSHAGRLAIGSQVRVPLGGRRVRGFVVELADRPVDKLKPIAGVSGELPVFDTKLRDALIWAAHHYVAPVSVTLERAAPPNLPGPAEDPASPPVPPASTADHPLDSLVKDVVAGRRRPITALLSSWEDMSWLAALSPVVADSGSVMVVVATAAEAEMVSSRARSLGIPLVEVTGELDDASLTRRWSEAATEMGRLVVGTPRVASWPVAGLRMAVVIEEGRRAMKDRQTPTVSARRLLMTRARLEGLAQVYVGPTPSVELLVAGAEIVRHGARAWPLVEVVDRNEEPPGSRLVSSRARQAIRSTLDRGGEIFVFTHRRGYAPAYRCSTCKELRRCPTCGSRPEPGEACRRCGAASQPCLNCGGSSFEPLGAGVGRVVHELRGVFPESAGDATAGTPVVVGTERDLAAIPGVDLAIAVDVDGLALGSNYRAGEEALRILARVAGRVRRGTGNRLMVQTSLPDQPLVSALRRGDPMEFLEHELREREAMGYPPASELIVVEIRGGDESIDTQLGEMTDDGVAVMGPAVHPRGRRWLIQGKSLGGFKLALRPVVQRWRDTGATVRIDVDPLDL